MPTWTHFFTQLLAVPGVCDNLDFVSDSKTVLDRLLDPLSECLSEDEVRRLTSLPPDPVVEERLEVLAAKANEGLLTAEERSEYELYIQADDFMSLLLAKARSRFQMAA